MKFHHQNTVLLENKKEGLKHTTHLSIVAHPDDIEILSYHGISECYQDEINSFTGVVLTNGSGSVRNGKYIDYNDEEMKIVRRKEQIKAAQIGKYGALVLLNYDSNEVKDKANSSLEQDLIQILNESKPEIIYTHNLFDKHETHISTAIKTINAIRNMDLKDRPLKIYGCEVWRDLDWLPEQYKVALDVSKYPVVASELLSVFDSQILAGKRYDIATISRRLANATFNSTHEADKVSAITYAIDLTPLVQDDSLEIKSFTAQVINDFKSDILQMLDKLN